LVHGIELSITSISKALEAAFVPALRKPRRTHPAGYTIEFLSRVVEKMPFAIQRIQTDRGGEFFAESVQRWLMQNFIKFRPIPPRSPHLNGKVERSQLTDLQELCTRHDPRDPEIAQRIEAWQFDDTWRRPQGSLGGKTPIECIRHRDYRMDQKLAALHAAALLAPMLREADR
jgi:transposase InsO family protein